MAQPDLLPTTACPACGGGDVDRLWVASWRLDTCRCRSCGRRWDEAEPRRR